MERIIIIIIISTANYSVHEISQLWQYTILEIKTY